MKNIHVIEIKNSYRPIPFHSNWNSLVAAQADQSLRQDIQSLIFDELRAMLLGKDYDWDEVQKEIDALFEKFPRLDLTKFQALMVAAHLPLLMFDVADGAANGRKHGYVDKADFIQHVKNIANCEDCAQLAEVASKTSARIKHLVKQFECGFYNLDAIAANIIYTGIRAIKGEENLCGDCDYSFDIKAVRDLQQGNPETLRQGLLKIFSRDEKPETINAIRPYLFRFEPGEDLIDSAKKLDAPPPFPGGGD